MAPRCVEVVLVLEFYRTAWRPFRILPRLVSCCVARATALDRLNKSQAPIRSSLSQTGPNGACDLLGYNYSANAAVERDPRGVWISVASIVGAFSVEGVLVVPLRPGTCYVQRVSRLQAASKQCASRLQAGTFSLQATKRHVANV